MKNFLILMKILLKQKKYSILYIFFMCFYVVFSVAYPYMFSLTIDRSLTNANMGEAIAHIVLVVLFGICMVFSNYLLVNTNTRIIQSLKKYLRAKLKNNVINSNIDYWTEISSEEIITAIKWDIEKVSTFFKTFFGSFIPSFIILGAILIIVMNIDVIIGFIVIITSLFYLVLQNILSRKIKVKMIQVRSSERKFTQWTNLIAKNTIELHLAGYKKYASESFDHASNHLLERNYQFLKLINKTQSLNSLVAIIITCSIFLFGLIRIQNQTLTVGVLLSLIIYVQKIMSPIKSVNNIYFSYKAIEPVMSKLNDIISNQHQILSGMESFDNDPLVLKFATVHYRYPNCDTSIIKDLSFLIKEGEVVAIEGENGAGKTTILRLISRLCTPTCGNIYINNLNIQKYKEDDYSSLFCCLTQDNFIMRGNIKSFFDSEYNKKILAQLENHFNIKIHNSVGENGRNYSGGELQKISLIRLMLSKYRLLILDEPTSMMDKDTRNSIMPIINQFKRNKIVIIITHQEDIIKKCDQVIHI